MYIARLLAISLKMAHTGKVKKTLHLDEKLQFYLFQFIRFFTYQNMNDYVWVILFKDFEIAVVLVQIKIGICKTLYCTHSKGLSSAMRPSAALDLSLK